MSKRLSLEEFDDGIAQPPPAAEPAPPAPAAPQIDVDAIRLEGYDTGYKSGWDDCHAEHLKSEDAIGSDLVQALREVKLTYQDARGDVLTAIRPVIEAIIERLLPKLATDGLGAMVSQELLPLIEDAADLRCELVAAPSVIPLLQKIVSRHSEIDVRLRPEPTYSTAQVSLRMGAEAREVDLGDAVAQISREIDEFTSRLIAAAPSSDTERTNA